MICLLLLVLLLLSLFFVLRATRLSIEYYANLLDGVTRAFLVFSAGIMFHFQGERLLSLNELVLVEHSLILLSFLYLLYLGMNALCNKEAGGLIK